MKLLQRAKLSKAGKPVPRPYAKKTALNKRFRTVHKIFYSSGSKARPGAYKPRDLQHKSFEEILGMTQRSCKSLLPKHGVIGAARTPPPEKVACWGCLCTALLCIRHGHPMHFVIAATTCLAASCESSPERTKCTAWSLVTLRPKQ